MLSSRKPIAAGILAALLAGLGAGCQTHSTTVPAGAGYEEVSHPHHTLIDDPGPPRISLQKKQSDGSIHHVWPSLYSVDIAVHENLALFIAERAYRSPDRVTRARLFAVESPASPLDLTDEVLWRWAKANGRKFEKALDNFADIGVAAAGDGVAVHIDFWSNPAFGAPRDDWPDQGTLQLTWTQVDEIVHAVKTKGVVQKDLRWGTPFVAEVY